MNNLTAPNPNRLETEFQIHRDALAKKDRPSPSLAIDLLRSLSGDPKGGEEVAREHHRRLYAETSGALLPLFTRLHAQILGRISEIKRTKIKIAKRRDVTNPECLVTREGAPSWYKEATGTAAYFLAACVVLLLVGWVALMTTLEESGFEAFESFFVRATFTLLPALGLTSGWKVLASCQRNDEAKRRYLVGITMAGALLGTCWVVLVGLTLGEAAWGEDLPLPDLDFEETTSPWMSPGVAMCIVGVLSETLLAASCWLAAENRCAVHRPVVLGPNPRFQKLQEQVDSESERQTMAIMIEGELASRIQSIRNGSAAYEERAVAALIPRWFAPEPPLQQETYNPRRPDAPYFSRNGNSLKEEIQA